MGGNNKKRNKKNKKNNKKKQSVLSSSSEEVSGVTLSADDHQKQQKEVYQSMKSPSDLSAFGGSRSSRDISADPSLPSSSTTSLSSSSLRDTASPQPTTTTTTAAVTTTTPKQQQTKRFTGRELSRLKTYLWKYKQLASSSSEQSSSTSKIAHDEYHNGGDDKYDITKQGIRIGGMNFPPLLMNDNHNNNTSSNINDDNGDDNGVNDVGVPPYLCFSSQLTSKQRKDIHRLAMEVGLFHCGYNFADFGGDVASSCGGNRIMSWNRGDQPQPQLPSSSQRFVAVSPFSDGLMILERKQQQQDPQEYDNDNDGHGPNNDNDNGIHRHQEKLHNDNQNETRNDNNDGAAVVDTDSNSNDGDMEYDDDDDDDDNAHEYRRVPFVPVQKYKPWICRKNDQTGIVDYRVNETKTGKDLIYELFDQPSMCVRDNIDVINFNTMIQDLSHRSGLEESSTSSSTSSSFLFVNSVQTMQQCLTELRQNRPTELAFDVECYNKSKYVQVTCLLQLSTNHNKDYVIDVLADDGAVWNMVGELSEFFTDPSIVKIGHAIGGLDVQCLHRDFGIFIVNVFDTYIAASHVPTLYHHGLAKVCRHYGLPKSEHYEKLKEKYQNSDWTRRPLPEPAVLYARYDVHYLLDLRKLLIRDLIKSELHPNTTSSTTSMDHTKQNDEFVSSGGIGAMKDMLRSFNEEDGIDDEDDEDVDLDFLLQDDDDVDLDVDGNPLTDNNIGSTEPKTSFGAQDLRMNFAFMAVISKSQDSCLGLWKTNSEPPARNAEYQTMLVQATKDGNPWTDSQVALYEQMADWRDKVANEVECLAGFVCTLEFLACVASKRPVSEVGLRQIWWHLPHLLIENDGRYAKDLLLMVQSSLLQDKIHPIDPFLTYSEYRHRRRSLKSKIIFGDYAIDHSSAIILSTAVAAVVAAAAFRYFMKPGP